MYFTICCIVKTNVVNITRRLKIARFRTFRPDALDSFPGSQLSKKGYYLQIWSVALRFRKPPRFTNRACSSIGRSRDAIFVRGVLVL